jgi:lycopene cyclase domain-containing protein
MTAYSVFNAVWLGIAVITAWSLLRDAERFMQVIRVATIVVIIAFPWDHVAVVNHVWDYGAPGPRLFGVPLNDSLFIFSCSIVSSCILLSKVMPSVGATRRGG